MDTLALLPRRLARGLIAGLLALVLVLQGGAAAGSARGAAFDTSLSSAHEVCADRANGDERGHSHERGFACSCCIPCRSDQIDLLAKIAAPSAQSLDFSPSLVGRVVRFVAVVGASSPCGWIGSWSQRAPPRRA